MSESTPEAHPTPIEYRTAPVPAPVIESREGFTLLKLGGMLGFIASAIGMLIFLIGCFGQDHLLEKAGLSSIFALGLIPLLLSVPGLLLSLIGGSKRGRAEIDPRVLAAVFVNILGLSGALLEIVVWKQWGFFFAAGGGA